MALNIQTKSIFQTPASFLTEKLGAVFSNRIITPDDPRYEQSRSIANDAYNNRRPLAVVQVANAKEVTYLVNFARENNLNLAVRSGGHSLSGASIVDDGIVLDLSGMKKLEFNLEERIAWAETGLTAGEYTLAAAKYGLATPFGDTASVGLGGLTLGGGVGYLVRKYGLTIDNLLAAELVTADGQLLQVDSESHPDLFWAIRGGGGNFGIATRFKFRLLEVDQVLGGMLILPATSQVLSGVIAAADAAPEELSTIINVMKAPPLPFLAAEHHGKLIVMINLVCVGDLQLAEQAVAPLRSIAAPLADTVRLMQYPEMYPPAQQGPSPSLTARTFFMKSVEAKEAEEVITALQNSASSFALVQFRVLGGAMARVPAYATAYAHRKARIMVFTLAAFSNPSQRTTVEIWLESLKSSLQQDEGAYVNFLGAEGADGVQSAYPGETGVRLAAIKSRYDPMNFFHLNQNIRPADVK